MALDFYRSAAGAERFDSRVGVAGREHSRFVARMQAEDVDAQLDAYYGTRTTGEKAEEARMVRAIRLSRAAREV